MAGERAEERRAEGQRVPGIEEYRRRGRLVFDDIGSVGEYPRITHGRRIRRSQRCNGVLPPVAQGLEPTQPRAPVWLVMRPDRSRQR